MMIFLVAVIQHSYTRRPATRTGVAQLHENAKLLVCCADSLFGLDVRSFGCVVLSSLHVPLRTVFHKSLLYLPQVCTNFLAGHVRVIRATTVDRHRM